MNELRTKNAEKDARIEELLSGSAGKYE